MEFDFRFRKKQRILNRYDFNRLRGKGRKETTRNFMILFAENSFETHRVGLTVSGKTGNAVVRNAVKRKLREYFRLNNRDFRFKSPVDINIIAKKGAVDLNFSDMIKELDKFFK